MPDESMRSTVIMTSVVAAIAALGCANRVVLDQIRRPSPGLTVRGAWDDDEQAEALGRRFLREYDRYQFIRALVRTTPQRLPAQTVLLIKGRGMLRVGHERMEVVPDQIVVVPTRTVFSSANAPCVEALVVAPAGGLADLEIGTCQPLAGWDGAN